MPAARAKAVAAVKLPVAGKRSAVAAAAKIVPGSYTQKVPLSRLMRAYHDEVPQYLLAKGIKPSDCTRMQRAVWAAVTAVPPGYVATYSSLGYVARWILKHEGETSVDDNVRPADDGVAMMHGLAIRAVGQALKRNPVAPTVPCHRCVRRDGDIGGFNGHTCGGEIDRKVQLLRSEGVTVEIDGGSTRVAPRCVLWE
jgi:O-6-methylguanine DNA methyltransferase